MHQVILDRKEQWVLQEQRNPAKKETVASQDILEQQEQTVHQVQMDSRDKKVSAVQEAIPDCQGNQVQVEYQAIPDRKETGVSMGIQVVLDSLEHQVSQEPQDNQVTKVTMGKRVKEVFRDIQVKKDLWVYLEQMVIQDKKEKEG